MYFMRKPDFYEAIKSIKVYQTRAIYMIFTHIVLVTTASWSIKLNLPTDVGALNLIILF